MIFISLLVLTGQLIRFDLSRLHVALRPEWSHDDYPPALI